LVRLVLRWLPEVHTFFFTWGEATPTLEDVAALLPLLIHGFHSFEQTVGDNALRDDDRDLLDILKMARKYFITIPSIEKPSSKVAQALETSSSHLQHNTDRRDGFPAWIQLWLVPRAESESQDPNIPS
ncbi:hypothetical protein MKX01_013749, partial [Papaver californicum]